MVQESGTTRCVLSLFVPFQRNQLLGGLRILIQSGNPYHQSKDSGHRHGTKYPVHRYRQPWQPQLGFGPAHRYNLPPITG